MASLRNLILCSVITMHTLLHLSSASPARDDYLDNLVEDYHINQPDTMDLVSLTAPAKPCDTKKCKLPDCLCSSIDPPGGMSVDDVPRMVLLTFQSAINEQNFNQYKALFGGRKNPNGCPARGTFYVSHNNTDYYAVQVLYSEGHEIGDHTVTAQGPAEYWADASYDTWKREIQSQRDILRKWSQIQTDDPVGFRAPLLEVGGDHMVSALRDSKLKYDASRVSKKYVDNNTGILWPYTYDYQSTQDCVFGSCPTQAYPGVWQIPVAELKSEDGWLCATPIDCKPSDEVEAYDLLMRNYREHDHGRAPYTLILDQPWLAQDWLFSALQKFVSYLLKSQDTYLVTGWQTIQWAQNPTPLTDIKSFSPWGCSDLPRKVCDVTHAITCYYDDARRLVPDWSRLSLRTCVQECPPCYPWLNDPLGQSC